MVQDFEISLDAAINKISYVLVKDFIVQIVNFIIQSSY